MEIEIRRDKGVSRILVKGSLDVERVKELKDALEKAINQSKATVLDVRGVERIHFSYLPLFCSAHKTSVQDGRSFHLVGFTDALRHAVMTSGFSHETGCCPDINQTCLWNAEKCAMLA